MKKNHINELKPIERNILTALLAPGTLADISNRTSIPRSSVEYILKKLVENKLVSFSLKGKRKYYYSSLSKTENISPPTYPITKFGPLTLYSGKDAIETLWQEIVEQPKESRLTGIQPQKSFHEALRKSSKKIVVDVSQKITDRRFILDAIVHEDMARQIFRAYKEDESKSIAKVFTGRPEDMVKVDPDFLNEKAELFMIGNCIFLIDWFEEIGIKIENNNIYSLFNSIHLAVKAYGKRYEQGKFIESLIDKKESK